MLMATWKTALSVIVLVSCIYLTSAKPTAAVVSKLSKLILAKLELAGPPPPIDKKVEISQMAKDHSVKLWRRNAHVENEYLEVAASVLQAKISSNGAVLVFPFNEDDLFKQGYSIKSATMNVIPKKELMEQEGPAVISVYRKKLMRYEINAKSVTVKNKPVQIDILADIQDWISKHGSKAEYRLKLRCGNTKPCIERHCKPFIDLVYQKLHDKQIEHTPTECQDRQCCRTTINVTIKDLGWEDWFFQPESFDYHYCTGSCKKQSKTYYDSILSSLESSTSCCAPTELTGLRALYSHNGLIYERYLDNVMANGCACGGIAGV